MHGRFLAVLSYHDFASDKKGGSPTGEPPSSIFSFSFPHYPHLKNYSQ